MIEVMPNFFIVGAAKAGTTSLYSYLRRHPDVYMSPIKEPHWFSRVKPHPEQKAYAVTSEKEYLDPIKGDYGKPEKGRYISHLYVELGMHLRADLALSGLV